jgi:hypothetical protein
MWQTIWELIKESRWPLIFLVILVVLTFVQLKMAFPFANFVILFWVLIAMGFCAMVFNKVLLIPLSNWKFWLILLALALFFFFQFRDDIMTTWEY